VVAPALARSGEITSAYFQIGDVAYAVVAVGDEARLKAAAEALARSLY
jgi:hypothetical protein